MRNHPATGSQPAPCDCCVPCSFFHRMMHENPELPSNSVEYSEALAALVADPETRAGLTRIMAHCDGMGESCVATAWLMLPHLGSGDRRTLSMVLGTDTRQQDREMVANAEHYVE